MFLLRRSDAPFLIQCRRVLVGRSERLDGRNGHHDHFYASLPLKVLADGPDALLPIPIDGMSMVAHKALRPWQLDLGPIIGSRLGEARTEDKPEDHHRFQGLHHRCSNCDSCSTARISSCAACRYRSKRRGTSWGPGEICPRLIDHTSSNPCRSSFNCSATSVITASEGERAGRPRRRCIPRSNGTVEVIESDSKIVVASLSPPPS